MKQELLLYAPPQKQTAQNRHDPDEELQNWVVGKKENTPANRHDKRSYQGNAPFNLGKRCAETLKHRGTQRLFLIGIAGPLLLPGMLLLFLNINTHSFLLPILWLPPVHDPITLRLLHATFQYRQKNDTLMQNEYKRPRRRCAADA